MKRFIKITFVIKTLTDRTLKLTISIPTINCQHDLGQSQHISYVNEYKSRKSDNKVIYLVADGFFFLAFDLQMKNYPLAISLLMSQH